METACRYALLVMEGHPEGQMILEQAMKCGLAPSTIVVEQSDLAKKRATFYDGMFAGLDVSLPIEFQARRHSIDVRFVQSHNSEESRLLLVNGDYDLLVLGNTRILKSSIFRIAKCISVHPGVLPWCRGSMAAVWSIIHGIPLGVTCHHVEKVLDAGAIIARETFDPGELTSIREVVFKLFCLSADLITALVKRFPHLPDPLAQDPEVGETFRWPNKLAFKEAETKLINGSYVVSKTRFPIPQTIDSSRN